MMLELSPSLSLRDVRLESIYTARRLSALEETRHLATDFEDAADKLGLLLAEEARFEQARVELQAMVEVADDAWDDVVHAVARRIGELSDHDHDHPLYRRYFDVVPTGATTLSYHAERMISRDLEALLADEPLDALASLGPDLARRREALEAILRERTRHEVERAKFDNRVRLARELVDRLRRTLFATLEEIRQSRGRDAAWGARFYLGANGHFEALDDGRDSYTDAEVVELATSPER
jgi:hypothetical protein